MSIWFKLLCTLSQTSCQTSFLRRTKISKIRLWRTLALSRPDLRTISGVLANSSLSVFDLPQLCYCCFMEIGATFLGIWLGRSNFCSLLVLYICIVFPYWVIWFDLLYFPFSCCVFFFYLLVFWHSLFRYLLLVLYFRPLVLCYFYI